MQTQLDITAIKTAAKEAKSDALKINNGNSIDAACNNENQAIEHVKELTNKLKLLEKQNNLYQTLLQLNDESIFVKSSKGNLVYANQAFFEHYPNEEPSTLIGKRIDTLFSKPQEEEFVQSDSQALTQGLHETTERIVLPDESEIIARVTKKSFVDEEGNQFIACISRDISEKEALIADLHRSNEDLDNFAYVASHDLRAPLNAVKTMINWVISDCNANLPQESQDNLALALSRAERMDRLLTDLLEYSRIGREKKTPVTFNLREKVLEWLELVDLPMGFGIQCDDTEVFLPETPLSIIMVNLISNAIKHHDSATANIKIKVRFNKHHTVIEVHDDGPGIPDKHKQKVFDLFQTLKSRDEVEASGMGLSAVKKIVLNYRGKIAIKDNSPRGCRFVIHWPTESE
ncbi:MAG: ATP-binding protein [Pseudomonadota bacterium]